MVKFDHTAETLQASMGIEANRADELTANLFFEMINVEQMAKSLFDDPDEAPANMTTKTGILERVMEDVTTNEEMVYVTWEYAKYDVLLKKDEKFALTHKLMLMSLYMFSNQDKEKFVKTFVKHKRDNQND